MIKIIEYREQDKDALQKLYLKSRLTTFSWTDTSLFNLTDFEKDTEGEYILTALKDETIVGFISVWLAANFVHHLYVDENFHNQQIGTQLLQAVIDKINSRIQLKCEENNTKAINFYRRKGFEETGRGQSEFGTYLLFELSKRELM